MSTIYNVSENAVTSIVKLLKGWKSHKSSLFTKWDMKVTVCQMGLISIVEDTRYLIQNTWLAYSFWYKNKTHLKFKCIHLLIIIKSQFESDIRNAKGPEDFSRRIINSTRLANSDQSYINMSVKINQGNFVDCMKVLKFQNITCTWVWLPHQNNYAGFATVNTVYISHFPAVYLTGVLFSIQIIFRNIQ